jgi:hypothetical protein
MVINDKAVLALGVLSVLGAVVYNHQRVYAASLPVAVVEMAAAVRDTPGPKLPPGYWTNPSTSPLAGVVRVRMPPASPIERLQAPVLNRQREW